MSIRNTVLQAIEFDKVRFNAIADSIEIPSTTLSRFVNEKRGIQFDFLERLCDHLQLRLVRKIEDFDVYCLTCWENGGRDAFKAEMESRKDEAWEQYVDENWEPDESAFTEYSSLKWKEYARVEWPEYADEHELDITDTDEIEHWKSSIQYVWLEELKEEWEEEQKELWIEESFPSWSEEYDEKLEDEEHLYESFCSEFEEEARVQSWISITESKK